MDKIGKAWRGYPRRWGDTRRRFAGRMGGHGQGWPRALRQSGFGEGLVGKSVFLGTLTSALWVTLFRTIHGAVWVPVLKWKLKAVQRMRGYPRHVRL